MQEEMFLYSIYFILKL